MGVSVARSLCIDWLHSLSLGSSGVFCMHTLHELLRRSVFGIAGSATAVFELGIRRLKSELFTWYTDEERAGRPHNRLTTLTPGMLGTYTDQAFKIHGAEANGILLFLIVLLRKKGMVLGPQRGMYIEAAVAMAKIVDLIKGNKESFSAVQQVVRINC